MYAADRLNYVPCIEQGYRAAVRHVGREDCPYVGKMCCQAWLWGFDEAKSNMAHGDNDGWYAERLAR